MASWQIEQVGVQLGTLEKERDDLPRQTMSPTIFTCAVRDAVVKKKSIEEQAIAIDNQF